MNLKYGVHPRVLFFAVLMVIITFYIGIQPAHARGRLLQCIILLQKWWGRDCGAWADACSLQTALAAVAPAEIWVKEGVHKPTEQAGDVYKHFSRTAVLGVYGGFAGIESARDQRDWKLNLTILSGDIEGTTSIRTEISLLRTWMRLWGRTPGTLSLATQLIKPVFWMGL